MTVYKDSPYTLAAEKYRPKRVRVLFVAEAPPSAVERYFFYENVDHDDWLWIALMKGLYPKEWRETKTERARKRDWLRKFQENEFWLVDAVKAPLSGSHAQRVRGISSAANGLIEQIQRIAPHQIVLIKATVHDALFQKLKKAGLSVINDESLPFPSSGQQARFHAGLRHLVNTGRL